MQSSSASESKLQRQLHHARCKADIGSRDLSECSRVLRNARRVVLDGPTGDGGVRKRELRGIRDIVGLGTERQTVLFGEREVFEDREVQASPVWTVALSAPFIPRIADSLLLEGIVIDPF